MGLIHRSERSKRDFAEIWSYVANEADDATANRVLRKLDSKLRFLSGVPGAGRPRDDLRPGLRSFPVRQYLLYYRPLAGGGIGLARVLHGRRDARRIFRRGGGGGPAQ